MKRFEMLPGIAVMRGNVTGAQDIRYQGNKKAYETANGKQASTNYRPSYIFHERAKDGLKYFTVRLRQTAVLNGKTRMQMAIVGAIAAIKSKLQETGDIASIKSAYDFIISRGLTLPEGVDTFNKYVNYYLRDMLRYKRAQWAFNQASIVFTVANPFKLDNPDALVIKQSIWNKFAAVLAFTEVSATPATRIDEFSIDGIKFINPNYSADFATTKGVTAYCTNLKTQWQPITLASAVGDANILFQGNQVYTDAGVVVNGETLPLNSKFTTIAPEA